MTTEDDDDFDDAFDVVTPTITMGSTIPNMSLDDFWSYAPERKYFYEPCNTLYVGQFIDSYFGKQPVLDASGNPVRKAGKLVMQPTTKMLDQTKWLNQISWAPGQPKIIEGRVFDRDGWKPVLSARCMNTYQPPRIDPGDAAMALPWTKHLRRIYPKDADDIERWLAHRLQRPWEKINHALVLIGDPGIGKDWLIEPVLYGVGTGNSADIRPSDLIGRTTDFLKSVVLRISEARDAGDGSGKLFDRYAFYEHCKILLASPPNVLRVNEKYIREYYVANVVTPVATSNHRNALYLPPDDRRHRVCDSGSKKADFTDDFWPKMWSFYNNENGCAHVVAHLRTVDLTNFDAKAAPFKGDAFVEMASRGYAPEETDLSNAIEAIKSPPALTIAMLAAAPGGGDFTWLLDKSARRAIPHWLERCDYRAVRNSENKQGLWRVKGRKQVVYARTDLSDADKTEAVQALVDRLDQDADAVPA
jgi:hypothetical protein